MEKSVAFHTLGCKVNRYETDAVAQTFIDAGYQIKPFDDTADVYVINTCTVTGEADRKSRQFLRQAKTRNPGALVVAMGCHVELSDASAYADILVGNKDKIKVVERVEKKRSEWNTIKSDIINTTPPDTADPESFQPIDTVHEFEEMGDVTSQEETRAYIKIEDGCNNFCSYCAIPLARGRVRSREESAILKEVKGLAGNGFQEIVLTGIHVCSYGADRGLESDALIDLTEKLSKIEGLKRIRLGSLEPQSLTEKFIQKASKIDILCPHFHLSLQSGSDAVLKRMNRRYTTGQYEQIVDNLKTWIPSAAITTDVIVGFPGETEEEHRQTMDFCEKIDFLDIHVFKYSERKGTKAAGMSLKVDGKTAILRSKELISLAQKMKERHFARSIGSRFRVLIEKIDDNGATGYTENYISAKILPAGIAPTGTSAGLKKFPESAIVGSIVEVEAVQYDQTSIATRFIP